MLREAEEVADAEQRDGNNGSISLTIINYHRSPAPHPSISYRSSFARAKDRYHRSPSPHPSISYKSAFALEKNRRRSSTRSSGGPA